jgi:hypothetical protein
MSRKHQFKLARSCVDFDSRDVNTLITMLGDARPISRQTFVARVDRNDLRALEMRLGYEPADRKGLSMADDYHVRYFKSKLNGRPVYYLVHSAIEHIFEKAEDV